MTCPPARASLATNGVAASEAQFYGRDGSVRPATDEDDLNNSGFVHFEDPDGNAWAVRQITARP